MTTSPSPNPSKITITEQGTKSDKKVTAYVKAMLEAFEIHGEFTLTTSFANKDGHSQKHGIRIRSHAHSGVELEIQPEPGSSHFYESWLIRKGHDPSELRAALHAKLAGQKRFVVGEWKDPDKLVRFEDITAIRARALAETLVSPPSEETEVTDQENESLKGYANNETLRHSILVEVYDAFQRRSLTAEQFVTLMRDKSGIRGSSQGLKVLLRRLTKMGCFNSKTAGPTETFSLSGTMVESLAELGLISVSQADVPIIATPETSEIVAKILDLSYRAEQFRLAKIELERLDDDEKLIADEITTLEGFLAKARQRLESAKVRTVELVKVTSDPAFSEASSEIASIVQRHQS